MDNKCLIKNIVKNFDYSINEIQNFDLGYRITRFITNKVELLSYSTRTKDFIFFLDKDNIENYISVYRGEDKKDNSRGIVIEMIFGEDRQKEIFYLSEEKMYLITESKWGKIINSSILTNEYKINNMLEIINNDLDYLSHKVLKYKNKLKYRGYLKKSVSENVINNFRLNFLTKIA